MVRAEPGRSFVPSMAERCPCVGLCGRAAAANSHHAQVDRPHPLVADTVNRPDFLTVEHVPARNGSGVLELNERAASSRHHTPKTVSASPELGPFSFAAPPRWA